MSAATAAPVVWQNRIVGYAEVAPDQLLAHFANVKIHPDTQTQAIKGILGELGWIDSVKVSIDSGRVIDGHDRVKAAMQTGQATVPVTYIQLTEQEELYALATFDPIGAQAATDSALLADLLADVQTGDAAVQRLLDGLATDVADAILASGAAAPPPASEAARQTLAERFGVPPFSVLDARQGYWQARKRAWIALGIQSELGRGDNLQSMSEANDEYRYNKAEYLARIGRGPLADTNGLLGESEQARSHYKGGSDAAPIGGGLSERLAPRNKGRGLARCYGQDLMHGEHTVGENGARLTWVAGDRDAADLDETSRKNLAAQPQSGTSIFDPVLCELVYRWFAPPGGAVLDPFAGGSVRGVVAALLGHAYTGIDLRAEQIAANEAQAAALCPAAPPRWMTGDSRDVAALAPGTYDLLFTCPPYADLEVYSDDPRDLSTLDYPAFVESYRAILAAACALLAPDRFAAIVVGDVRDGKGFYRNLVSATIAAFQDAGLRLYNEAILVTAVGSLPIRVGKQFGSYRKLGKTHQNVLVFYNGDPRKIKDFGAVEMGDPESMSAADDPAADYGEVLA